MWGGCPGAQAGMFHDMSVTDNFYVFHKNPVHLDNKKLLTEWTIGKASIAGGCIVFDRECTSQVILIPRPGNTSKSTSDQKVRHDKQNLACVVLGF